MTHLTLVPQAKKQCHKCGKWLRTGEFHKDKTSADGFDRRCKQCKSNHYLAYYAVNGEQRRAAHRAHHRKNRDAIIARRLELIGEGKCQTCTRELIDAPGKVCRRCWFRQVASARTGAAKNAPMLEELWLKQGGRCAITGHPLCVERGPVTWDSASLDHIIPKSVRPDLIADPSNIRWVCHQVNMAKGALSDADFFDLCRMVLSGPAANDNASVEESIAC